MEGGKIFVIVICWWKKWSNERALYRESKMECINIKLINGRKKESSSIYILTPHITDN